MKPRDEDVRRVVVEILRRVNLLKDPIIEYGDPRTHGHGLDLIVGHVDERRFEALMELADLSASLDPELGVQVGQGLVHQEDVWLTHDGSTDCHALALTTRKLLRLAIEEAVDSEDVGSLLDTLPDLLLRGTAKFETEGHVVVHVHVRVEGVGLEHHGDVSVLRRHIVDDPVPDQDLALCDFVQPSQQTKAGGLPTSGRADKDQELLVLNVNIEVIHGHDIAPSLGHMLVGYACHLIRSFLYDAFA